MMRIAIFALTLATPLMLFGALPACEDDTKSSGPTFDGSTGTFDSGPGTSPDSSTGTDTGGGTPGVCTEANYVNGTVANPPNGRMSHHIQNLIDAIIVTSTGTISCEAKFNASGGAMVGGVMSGEYDIQCNDTKDAEYYGFHIHGLGKLGAAGTQYTIGNAAAVGGALNDQVDLTWESGSRCGAKATTLREWAGGPSIPGRGIFVVDEISGSAVKFHISPTDMKVSPKNVAGKGTFTLDVKVIDAAPLTIVGL
jgi:hypothetical protein